MAKKILVVEDEPAHLVIVKDTLEDIGYEVITAININEAIEKVKREIPDLVLIDIMIPPDKDMEPDMDGGWKVCDFLKNNLETKNIPVIIFTAKQEDEKKGKEYGVVGYYIKPFSLRELAMNVRKTIGKP